MNAKEVYNMLVGGGAGLLAFGGCIGGDMRSNLRGVRVVVRGETLYCRYSLF